MRARHTLLPLALIWALTTTAPSVRVQEHPPSPRIVAEQPLVWHEVLAERAPAVRATRSRHVDPAQVWAHTHDVKRLRECEATGDYTAVSPSGRHRGAYQFLRTTWHSVGGHGDPAAASRLEQDRRAYRLYLEQGWTPWECAKKLGLRGNPE